MTVQLGKKIRELRKNKNISQEVLAQYLGVSFQAVSKWENESALPDITLIPAIASFFGVSTDDLFDYNRMETEKKIMAICEKSWECRDDDPAKAEKILRDGLKKFPGSDVILNNLLYTLRSPERNDEVITICKTLIGSTKEDDVKYDAIRILAETYHDMGEQGLAEQTLELIPEIYFTRLEVEARLSEGERSFEAAQKELSVSSHMTADMLMIMQSRAAEAGRAEEAEKYGRLAKEIVALFRREFDGAFSDEEYSRL